MHAKVGIAALVCLSLVGPSNAVAAAPKTKSVKTPTTKHKPPKATFPTTKAKPKKKVGGGATGPSAPPIDKGDSAWVQGSIQYLQVDGTGMLQQIRLVDGSTTREMIFSPTCPAHQRIMLSAHPELVAAWDNRRKISMGVVRTTGSGVRFCTYAVGLQK